MFHFIPNTIMNSSSTQNAGRHAMRFLLIWSVLCCNACSKAQQSAAASGPIKELDQSLVGQWQELSEPFNILTLKPEGAYHRSGKEVEEGNYRVDGDQFEWQAPKGSRKNRFILRGDLLIMVHEVFQGQSRWAKYRRLLNGAEVTARPSEQVPLLSELAAAIQVSGTLKAERKSFSNFNQSGTYMEWELDLVLTNGTRHDLTLGNTLAAAQISTDGLPTGYLRICGPSPVPTKLKSPDSPHSTYFLDDFDSTDGGRTVYVEGARFQFSGKGDHPPHSGYGVLAARSKKALFESLSPNVWLKQGAIADMRIVLPDLHVLLADGKHATFHLTASLKKLSGGEEKSEWQVHSHELVSDDPAALERMVSNADGAGFRKILAMNWLIAADPENAGKKLAAATAHVNQGQMLGLALRCCAAWNLPGFESRALELEEAEDTPIGIALAAGNYLEVTKTPRHWKKLTAETSSKPAAGTTSPSLGVNQWVAAKIEVAENITVRRISAKLDGPASDEVMTLHRDGSGQPGTLLTELAGAGGEGRCKQVLSPGVYWLVIKRPKTDNLGAYWPLTPSNKLFSGYATSSNGGSSWQSGKSGLSCQCELWRE
ncbi:MAG TPA: hypothetical protein PLB55_01320 [Prosthecobacter sp.]|jgi:hypothetical protein|nr:hypothetical protein [Prosthecobacter sp.]